MTHSAKKSLGQNFLVDDNVVRKIIHGFSPRRDELVVEIGPGQGALTAYLGELEVETIAVELDNDLVGYLRKQVNEDSSVEIRHQDILETDLREIAVGTDKPLRVLGNIPYNITSPLLFRLIEQRDVIRDAYLMVQLELANRMTAEPSDKSYGILSVLLQTYADAELEFKVSKNVFRPRPKVASGVVSIRWHQRWASQIPDTDLYRVVVRTAFGKRRKTLRNALGYLPLTGFDTDQLEFDMSKRAEELTVRDFILLTREIGEKYPDYQHEIQDSPLL